MNLGKSIVVDFLKGVGAGFFIGFGTTVFLLLENKMFASFLFSLGLLCVCFMGLNLYTGKVGFLADHPWKNLRLVVLSWLGNFAGMQLSALLLCGTRLGTKLAEKGQAVIEVKNADNAWSLLVLGIYCGMLMYTAVGLYNRGKDKGGMNFVGALGICMCVMMFIQCGFEHSIADMFYYMISGNMYTAAGFGVILIVTLGNAIGGVSIRALDKYVLEKFI